MAKAIFSITKSNAKYRNLSSVSFDFIKKGFILHKKNECFTDLKHRINIKATEYYSVAGNSMINLHASLQ